MFAKPVPHIEHQIAYSPVWIDGGTTASSYGPGWRDGFWYGLELWGGSGGTMAVPYDLEVTSLQGTAIRYMDSKESASK